MDSTGMGRNNRAMKTQPCQYRREPAGMKRITATKMTAMRQRRMSRVLRLRGVDIAFAVYEIDKERVAESSYSNLRRGGGAAEGEGHMRRGGKRTMGEKEGGWRKAARGGGDGAPEGGQKD